MMVQHNGRSQAALQVWRTNGGMFEFTLSTTICRFRNSKVGFIRWFGGEAGLAARQSPFAIIDSLLR